MENEKETKGKLKRYKSAYLFFFENEIKKKKQENNTFPYIELVKEIGKKWTTLSKEEKEKYINLEKIEKNKFNKEKGNSRYLYQRSKKVKKPKRFRTAYMFFLHEKKTDIDRQNVISSLKTIGKEWKNLTEEQRKIYKEKEIEDKLRYVRDFNDYIEKILKQKKNKKDNKKKILDLFKVAKQLYKNNESALTELKSKLFEKEGFDVDIELNNIDKKDEVNYESYENEDNY